MDILKNYLNEIQYTPGDLVRNHDAISAVIQKDNKILMMDHIKYNLWTIPIGKVEKNQTIEQGLKQELKEEINIIPIKFEKITTFKKSYMREGKKVTITNHMFKVESWRGDIRNNEPKKHRKIEFLTLDEIKKIRNLSDSTKEMLKII